MKKNKAKKRSGFSEPEQQKYTSALLGKKEMVGY